MVGLAFTRQGTRSSAERAFLAVTTAAIPWVVVEVAVFASGFSIRIEERYMFFLAPLLFLAFALWLDRGLPRPLLFALPAAAIPAALLFALPLASLLNISILSDTFGLIPFLRLSQRLVPGGIPEARHFMLAGGIAAALAFVLWPRNGWPALLFPAAVATFLVLSSYSVEGALRDYSRGLKDAAGTLGSPSWIDQRLGSNGNATFLLGTTSETWPETLELWQTQFWNRSLHSVYNLSTPEPAGGPETPSPRRSGDRADPRDRLGQAADGFERRLEPFLRARRPADRRASPVCALPNRRAAARRSGDHRCVRRWLDERRCRVYAIRGPQAGADHRDTQPGRLARPGRSWARDDRPHLDRREATRDPEMGHP